MSEGPSPGVYQAGSISQTSNVISVTAFSRVIIISLTLVSGLLVIILDLIRL